MVHQPNPDKVKVRLNIDVTWRWNDHLSQISEKRKVSKAQLIRDALEKEYPLPVAGVRAATRDAGATR